MLQVFIFGSNGRILDLVQQHCLPLVQQRIDGVGGSCSAAPPPPGPAVHKDGAGVGADRLDVGLDGS